MMRGVRRRRALRWGAALLLLTAGCAMFGAGRLRANQDEKGQAEMSEKKEERKLPFGLKEDQLKEVEVMLGFYSAKTGAGKQEMSIDGTGKVKLFMTRVRDGEPETREGQVEKVVVVTLLDFLEGQEVLGMDDVYPSDHDPHARRLIRVTLPGQVKNVALDEPGVPAFEQIFGAVRLACGVGMPEALNHRFFPNL
jgi:hypothetical protein